LHTFCCYRQKVYRLQATKWRCETPVDQRSTFMYTTISMKQGIHADNYRPVVFQDISNGEMFLTRSTAKTEETIKYTDGAEYPLVKVHISSASHPFFTGQEKLVDVEGRVDKFKARAKKAQEAREKKSSTAPKAKKEQKESAQKIG
jgi:large subunit ribosomal protein L31